MMAHSLLSYDMLRVCPHLPSRCWIDLLQVVETRRDPEVKGSGKAFPGLQPKLKGDRAPRDSAP